MNVSSRGSQRVTALAAVGLLVLGWYLVAVRALGREGDAISDAGGDAGLYGVGAIVLTTLLVPSLVLLALAAVVRGRRAAALLAALSSLATAVVIALVAPSGIHMDRNPERGVNVPVGVADSVERAYLLGFAVMGLSAVAGLLVVIMVWRAGKEAPAVVSAP